MILLQASFTTLLILSIAYSSIAGGRSGWIACLMMFIAAVATYLVTQNQGARVPLLLVDLGLLIGLMWVSLTSTSFWPLWTAGLQASGVASNIAVLMIPPIDFKVYHAVLAFWSIPIFVVMPLGIYLDRRALRRHASRRERPMGQG